MTLSSEAIRRLSRPVPRYTSYPTANHFSADIRQLHYVHWLADLDASEPLSIYLHIPFCHALCWYCACTTKAVRRYEPVRRYVDSLLLEIANVASLIPHVPRVAHIHWGGGSPSLLGPQDIERISSALHRAFALDAGCEMAVEIDPRHLSEESVAAFVAAGVNRVSLGVQDFDPQVQAAIGREQSFAMTERAVGLFEASGVQALNIDLVYGLPRQTLASLEATISDVLALAPTRIAAFGYAHLPARVASQRLIDATALPDEAARFEQARLIAARLGAAGYASVGIDHYARSDDPLAKRTVHRNFQGYTSDAATSLLGFGASAIGKLERGYVQNAVPTREYERLIREHGLATTRGMSLSPDDRVRGFAIERLMCDFRLSLDALRERFGAAAAPVAEDAVRLLRADRDGILEMSGSEVAVTERGRPFVRAICAGLDRYLAGPRAGQHSAAI